MKFLPKFVTAVLTVLVFAQLLSTTVSATSHEPTPTTDYGNPVSADNCPTCEDGQFYRNEEVTFVGRNAARSGHFLDWTLRNYKWVDIAPGTTNPLLPFWARIRNIVLAMFVLFVMTTAFILIITRGKSITAKKFILRYLGVILLVLFSFALIEFIYQIIDIFQGFFIRIRPPGSVDPDTQLPNETIYNKDLLFVGWDYHDFLGFRKWGDAYNESAFISLLLVKLTALTYYVMVGILIIRKIILWFFIIISPVFPILLLYYPLRNTAKIWIGEFFRWLLYGPLFALFLAGLVSMWKMDNGIPLRFDNSKTSPPDVEKAEGVAPYTTSINIVLGGPGQKIGRGNSVNYVDTFALYVIALIMLWTVIVFPWVLLQIFLDYAMNYSYGSSAIYKQVSNFLGRGPSPPEVPPAPKPSGTGTAMPFAKKFSIPQTTGKAMEVPVTTTTTFQTPVVRPLQQHSEIMKLTNLSVPTMRDIAKYETAMYSNNVTQREEVQKVQQTLERIANPTMITTSDRQQYQIMREKLVTESKKGNTFATSILKAASSTSMVTVAPSLQVVNNVQNVINQIANPAVAPSIEREQIKEVHNTIIREKEKGNQLATIILTTKDLKSTEDVKKLKDQVATEKDKGNPVAEKVAPLLEKAEKAAAPALKPATFPTVNRVQAVSLDDYETVKKMWTENYQNLEVPQKMDGTIMNRSQWIEDDITTISNTINLLSSQDQQQVKKGMEAVSNILPFLLIGGFSQSEITAYMKAKLEAAKGVLSDVKKKEEEEATTVTTTRKTVEVPKEQAASYEVSEPASTSSQQASSFSSSSSDDDQTPSPLAQVAVQQPVSHIVPTASIQRITFKPDKVNVQILNITNITLPKISDIVRYEKHTLSPETQKVADVTNVLRTLEYISRPETAPTAEEKTKYKTIKERLVTESKTGEHISTAILTASGVTTSDLSKIAEVTIPEIQDLLYKIAHPVIPPVTVEQQQVVDLRNSVDEHQKKGSKLASRIVSSYTKPLTPPDLEQLKKQILVAKEKGDPLAAMLLVNARPKALKAQAPKLPTTNRIQTVNVDDYERVKGLWHESYQHFEVPQRLGEKVSRKQWIEDDMRNISETINLLSSQDPYKVQYGMQAVSNILPFLLIGGFSQTEIITYLKAKLEAGKGVLAELPNEEEEPLIPIKSKEEKEKEVEQKIELPLPENEVVSTGTSDTAKKVEKREEVENEAT